MTDVRLTVWVDGRVQGVGFRYWVQARATELGLRGSAANLADGRVAIVVEGPRSECEALLARVASDEPPGFVGRVVHEWSDATGDPPGFRVG